MSKKHWSSLVDEKKFIELDKKRHDRVSFNCNATALNHFLQKFSAKHMQAGISRTMVLPATSLLDNDKQAICSFYTIAPGAIARKNLPVSLANKLPHYPVPVFLLAQLAVDQQFQSQGLGKITLLCALKHLYEVSLQMKSYAVVVDCLDDEAQSFYSRYGFEKLDSDNVKMFLPMKTIVQLFE